jgi:hypothetical protein
MNKNGKMSRTQRNGAAFGFRSVNYRTMSREKSQSVKFQPNRYEALLGIGFEVGHLALCLGTILPAQLTHYVESISGGLSTLGTTPTFLNFDVGLNTVSGTMGRPNRTSPIEADIFTFSINPGEWGTSISILNFFPGFAGSFFAISGSNRIGLVNPSLHLRDRLIDGTEKFCRDWRQGRSATRSRLWCCGVVGSDARRRCKGRPG